jgi:hypothetical protein
MTTPTQAQINALMTLAQRGGIIVMGHDGQGFYSEEMEMIQRSLIAQGWARLSAELTTYLDEEQVAITAAGVALIRPQTPPDAALTDAQIAFVESLAQADELTVRVWDADFIAGGGVDLAARGLIFDEAIAAFGFHEVHVTCDAIEAAKLSQAAHALPFDGPIEDTDYPALFDPRDARIAELEAQVKALEIDLAWYEAHEAKAIIARDGLEAK